MSAELDKKILLIGEYSGVHTNLRHGLRFLGYSVSLAGDGDVFKNFDMDIDLRPKTRNKYIRLVERIYREIRLILSLRFKEYYCIQLMGPYALSEYIPFIFYRILKLKAHRLILYAGGEDYFFWRAYRLGRYRYSINDVILSSKNSSKFERGILKGRNVRLADFVDGIISGSIMYEYGYQDQRTYIGYLPFPVVVVDGMTIKRRTTRGEIRVVLSRQLGRELEKGFWIFSEALDRYVKENPGKVEIISVENLSHTAYTKILEEADVLLDQIYGYDPGMNALLGLSKGLVVLGGKEPEYVAAIGADHSSLINVVPNSELVYETLKRVLDNFDTFDSSACLSTVVSSHDSRSVAKSFLTLIT